MPPVVSIIIPVYNCRKFIAEALESVIQQTFRDFEALIVDDGSTDDLRVIADHYVKMDSRIKYLYQLNRGVSAARNSGFKYSSGKFIAFLDSDDVWLKNNIELKLRKLEEGVFGLVHSDAELINESSDRIHGVLQGREGDLLEGLLSWEDTQIPGPSSILMRRAVIEEVGPFDENLSTAADLDLFIRVAARYKIGRVDQVTWRYRKHVGNMHKSIDLMEHDVLLIFRKAKELNLFTTAAFERKCFSTTYLILAASWAGDGRNVRRALSFLIMAVRNEPRVILNVVRRAVNWIIK